MIVDTSALVAAATGESGADLLKRAMLTGGRIPAPTLVEYRRVMTRRGSRAAPEAEAFLQNLLSGELIVEPFTAEDAVIASEANVEYGAGNGRGGRLNLLDLMVYATARRLGLPILCTGTDFASTGIPIHPASRLG
ncbi:MAG TPA: type II toxin-antitoxin system VapC family toxin [Allosphingosinicella sp.]|nr:type II toxin-antitoxin system VapC family toxin [Allosphingosinicella sp.]